MIVVPAPRFVRAVAAWAAAALGVVAWPPLWLPLVAALGVLVVLTVRDALALRRVAVPVLRRRVPERAPVGRPVDVTIEVENPGAAVLHVALVDEAPAAVAPAEPSFPALAVAPGATAAVRWVARPATRGDHVFGPIWALVSSPLGLLCRRVAGGGGETLRAHPDASAFLSRDAMRPRRVLGRMGVRLVRRRGEGMEFESLRDYVAGDDPRRIDWAATARRGRLVSRLYRHERNHTVIVALDASRLMASPVGERTKLDHAVDAALALAWAAMASGDRVGLLAFDAELRGWLAPRMHRRQLGSFVAFLATLAPRTVEARYDSLARGLAAHHGKRSLVILLTDFVEVDPSTMIAPLVALARHHRVLLVALRDPVYDTLVPGDGDDGLGMYRRLVLDDLLAEREATLARLRRRGVEVADLAPRAVTGAVLARYLALRQEGPR
jgi:uncharacterized protein (DUF58 family)